MYDINVLETLVRSNLSEEEVCKQVLEMNPIATKQKYANDEEQPIGIYVGGLGEQDLVTVNAWMYPLTMKFDDRSVYVDLIHLIRKKLAEEEESFEKAVMKSIRILSKKWFHEVKDEESKKNAELAKYYMDNYKNPAHQRDGYAGDLRVSYEDEESQRTIYGISKMKGVGDLAKCVEVNALACNLLAFCGLEPVLIQGYYVNYNGTREAHTFPVYKNKEGNYTLLDCILKIQKKNVLPGDTNFELGVSFEIPMLLQYPDGREKEVVVMYTCPPQKKVEKKENQMS